jgi:subtilisin family serine protease
MAALLVIGSVVGVGVAVFWLAERSEKRAVAVERPAEGQDLPRRSDLMQSMAAPISPAAPWAAAGQGTLLEKVRQPTERADQVREVSVYRTDFKYPLVRVERLLQQQGLGHEQVVRTVSMVADHLLVKRPEAVLEEVFQARLNERGLEVRRQLPGSSLYLVAAAQAPSIAEWDEWRAELGQAGDWLAYAEPDFIVHHHEVADYPDDASFAQQWHLHNTGQSGGVVDADIDAPEAWTVTKGSAEIVVGVIDTGLDLTHPDLLGNLWFNPGESGDGKESDGIDNDGNGYIDDVHGWNFVTQTASPQDDNGHGTHTGGTVGAVGGNGIGVTGVCQTVSLMGLKFLSATGSGTTSDAVEAIRYATQMGVMLTSNSWGGAGFSQALLEVIEEANAAGVGFVAAAGNSGLNNDLYPEYPGSFQVANLISVAATDHADQLVWFSNFGQTTVHLAAAGLQTLSTGVGGSYVLNSGTSMAAPQVAGAAALLKAANPGLSFQQIKAMLLEQVDPHPTLAGKTVTGGRLNVAKAMVAATGPQVVVVAEVIEDLDSASPDGIASPGEQVRLRVTLKNRGGEIAEGVAAALSLPSAPAGLSLLEPNASYGDLLPDATAENAAGTFELLLDPELPTGDYPLRLELTASGGQQWGHDGVLKVRTVALVEGVVTRLTGGEPIAAARITLTGPEIWTAETAEDGSYRLKVTNGSYQVAASAAGFLDAAPVTVTVPPAVAVVNFALGFAEQTVAPLSFAVTQPEDSLTTQTLTISNTGDQALTYQLREVPAPPVGISAQPVVTAVAPPLAATPLELSTAPARQLPPPLLRGLDASDNTATSLPFRDGFEDGLWGRWWESWGAARREVVAGRAALGDRSFEFELTGAADHFTGIHQIFPFGTQPGYISFWTQPGASHEATSYMVLLDLYLVFDGSGLRYEIADFIWFFANANGRFYLNDDAGGNQSVLYTPGQWYHVEFRNLDWQSKRFDYWVNGQLIQSAVPFRNPVNANGMAYALSYNYSPNTAMGLDEAQFLPDELPWLQQSAKSGTVPPGEQVEVTVTFDSNQLAAGDYHGTLELLTNDPQQPTRVLPVALTVTPVPNAAPVAEPQEVTMSRDLAQTVTLGGSDADGDPLFWQIVRLPEQGTLYQTADGVTPGEAIRHTPRTVMHPERKVIFVPAAGTSGVPYASFDFLVRDAKLSSAPATVSVAVMEYPLLTVSPAGASSAEALNVQFSSNDPAATIRFTTDGSGPASAGHTVSSGFTLRVDHSLTVQAVAVAGERVSPVQTHGFTILDSNGNGLPDWWEALHGAALGDVIDLTADPDFDGLSHWQEFVLGTDPAASDGLKTEVAPAHPPVIEWPTVVGRFYTVEASEDGRHFVPISPPQAGTGGLLNHRDDAAPPDRRIYRVTVSLP